MYWIKADFPWTNGNPYLNSQGEGQTRKDLKDAEKWEEGRTDRMRGEPCKSNNGKYLEGWYHEAG